MPELPEVETIRRDLENFILHKKIKSIKINFRNIVKSDYDEFSNTVKNNNFKAIKRVGKLLIFELEKGSKVMLLHLKMTGQLIYVEESKKVAGGHNLPKIDTLPSQFTALTFDFSDNSHLYFNDMRRFAVIKLIKSADLPEIYDQFGPEPNSKEFTKKYLAGLFSKRTAGIKSILLNQKIIAGIGNIYADEILHASGIFPTRAANSLTKEDIDQIYKNSNKIIKKALKFRGTTFDDYRDGRGEKGNFSKLLKAYGQVGKKCSRCNVGTIRKGKVAGRGTSFCDHCQK